VVNLAFGALFLIFGVYFLIAGAAAVQALFQLKQETSKVTNQLPGIPKEGARQLDALTSAGTKTVGGMMMTMVRILAVGSMLQGIPLLLAGYGVLRRRQWARVLALVFGVLAGLEGLGCLFGAKQSGSLVLISGLILVGYAVLNWVGLLGRRASFEFAGGLAALSDPFARQWENAAPIVPEPRLVEPLPTEPARSPDENAAPAIPEARPEGRPLPDEACTSTPHRPLRVSVPVLVSILAVLVTALAWLAIVKLKDKRMRGDTLSDEVDGKEKSATPKYQKRLALFLASVDKGQVSRALELVREGVHVDDKDQRGETALMKAAARGHSGMVVLLLALGSQLNDKDRKGQTALMQAAAHGHGAVVDLLVSNASAAAEIQKFKNHFLNFHLPAAGKLLDPLKDLGNIKGQLVDLNARDDRGQTALMKAVAKGHIDIARTLFVEGADPNLTDEDGNTIYHLAAARGQTGAVQLIRSMGGSRTRHGQLISLTIQPEDINRRGMTAWMTAAANGHLATLKGLLPGNPTKDFLLRKDRHGKTAYESAADKGHEEVTAFLKPLVGMEVKPVVVLKPVEPHPKPVPPVLAKATRDGDLQAVQNFLKTNTSVEGWDKQGATALMDAAARGHDGIVTLLCTHTSKLQPDYFNLQDKQGRTALLIAAARGHTATVEELLLALSTRWDRGQLNWFSCLNQRDNTRKTALQLARAGKHEDTAELLTAYTKENLDNLSTALGRTALEQASLQGDLRSVRSLLKLGASLKQRGSNKTPLILAAEAGHVLVVRALLKSFPDEAARVGYVQAKEASGMTALMYAAEKGHPLIVMALLLAFGKDDATRTAHVNQSVTGYVMGQYGTWNALQRANHMDHREVVLLLKRYGAK
jgi:ankyrin repeat protein